MAVGYQWASRIITVSLEMVVPGLIGLAVDRWLGTLGVFTTLGFAFGMTAGIWHLIKLAKLTEGGGETESRPKRTDRHDENHR